MYCKEELMLRDEMRRALGAQGPFDYNVRYNMWSCQKEENGDFEIKIDYIYDEKFDESRGFIVLKGNFNDAIFESPSTLGAWARAHIKQKHRKENGKRFQLVWIDDEDINRYDDLELYLDMK